MEQGANQRPKSSIKDSRKYKQLQEQIKLERQKKKEMQDELTNLKSELNDRLALVNMKMSGQSQSVKS